MKYLTSRKALWLSLAGTVLLLAIVFLEMSLASAQTPMPGATPSLSATASRTTTAAGTPGATQAVTSTVAATATLQLALPQRSFLPLDLALKAANAALNKCTQGGYKVTVTVVDAEGVQKVALSQDGANPATQTASYRKAFTAASLGGPTSALAERIAANPPLAGVARLDDRMLVLAGGVPIISNNQLVGGIGVGGAPSGITDETCARAGLDSLR